VGEGDDGLSSLTDKKDFITYLGIEPFSQLKTKWLSGIRPEMGAWFCNVDDRGLVTSGSTTGVIGNALVTGSNIRTFAADNACGRLRIQDLGNAEDRHCGIATRASGKVFPVGCLVSSCSGRGGSWTDVFLNYRYQF